MTKLCEIEKKAHVMSGPRASSTNQEFKSQQFVPHDLNSQKDVHKSQMQLSVQMNSGKPDCLNFMILIQYTYEIWTQIYMHKYFHFSSQASLKKYS